MNIVQVAPRYYPNVGGVETYIYNVSEWLINEGGHEVTVVAPSYIPEGPKSIREFTHDIIRLEYVATLAGTAITHRLPQVLIDEIKSADIVHTHLPTPWVADWASLIGELTGTPVVLTYHNDIVGEGVYSIIAKIYQRSLASLTLSLCDEIISTQASYKDSSPLLSRFSEKIRVIPNGVNCERFNPNQATSTDVNKLGFKEDRQNIFFLSTLNEHHEYKGIRTLIKAVEILARSNQDIPHVVVGGEGPLKETLASKVSACGIGEHITFAGWINDEDLVSMYTMADAFVLPSEKQSQEGYGLVALEALACGTPVVTTPIVGVSDDIKELDIGKVARPNDAKSLAENIMVCLSAEYDSNRIQEIAKNYSWERSARQIENCYINLLE